MTVRPLGSRPLRFRTPARALLTALATGALLACSAAPPAPGGTSSGTQGGQDTPGESPQGTTPMTPAGAPTSTLPPGVTTSTNADGEVVYMDETGAVLSPMVVTNDDGSMSEVLVNEQGSTVGEVVPTPVSTPGSGATPAGPVVLVDDQGPDDIITQMPDPVVEDGTLVDGMVCNSAEVSYEPVIPTVMLLMDRSTSMFCCNGEVAAGGVQLPNGSSPSPVGSYPDRWEALRAAVNLLEPYASEVQFGAMTYTGYMEGQGPGVCPELQGESMPIGLDNFAQVQSLLPASSEAIPPAKSETPTPQGIAAAATALAGVDSDGPKYLLLITDGLPEPCGFFDRGPHCGSDDTIAAVQAAHDQGIQTFVIGIGFDQNNDPNEGEAASYLLNAAAHAGRGLEVSQPPNTDNYLSCITGAYEARTGMPIPNEFWTGDWRDYSQAVYGAATTFVDTLYYLPDDNNLGSQLAEVVEATRSCAFEMEDNVIREEASRGAVQLTLMDGSTVDVPFEDANGWVLAADRDDVVELQGTACTQVQSDSVESVRIEFPCEVRIPKAR